MATADATQQKRLLAVETSLGQDVLLLNGIACSERLSGLFDFDLDLLAELPNASKIQPEKLIGQPMTVKVALGDDPSTGKSRHFHGIVSRFSVAGRDERFAYYEAELVPWLWLLTRTADCRIFQDKSSLEIVKEIFDDLKGNFSFVDYEDKTTQSYTKLDYCVQYRETDFNFVSRLMEQEGIYYYFTHSENGHTLVLADSGQAHDPCPEQDRVRYEPEGGVDERAKDTITSWEMEKELRPGKYVSRDYHFQMPDKTLEVSEPASINVGGNGKLEVFDFPGDQAQRFNKPDQRLGNVESEGRKLAKLRMEEEESPHHTVNGGSNTRTLLPGCTFQLTDHPEDSQNGEYLLTSVQHSAVQSPDYFTGEETGGEAYQNSFSCIPRKAAFRPQRTTPKPVVEGLQSAVVVGKNGEEIWTDKYGRVRIQFHWDREGKKDEKSTCWVRVAQAWAGKQWGAHFWPRINDEVLVAFMEGDPDRPVLVGSLYNADQMPPYKMPDNQTRSGIKTRSSKNGGKDNFNELRFEDKKDEEEIYIHAEKDLNGVVENNETRKVGFDKKDKGNQTIEIFNNQDLTVGNAQASDGSRTVEIWKNDTETVKTGDRTVTLDQGSDTHHLKMGDRDVKIDMGDDTLTLKMGDQTTKLNLGKSSTEAMRGIELKVGQNSIKIDPTGITIKGLKVKIEGQMMTDVKGMMTNVKGDAMLKVNGGIAMIN